MFEFPASTQVELRCVHVRGFVQRRALPYCLPSIPPPTLEGLHIKHNYLFRIDILGTFIFLGNKWVFYKNLHSF